MYQPATHSLIWALSMYNKALSFVRTIGRHRQRHCRWKVFAFISTWYVDVFETNLFTHSFISISMRNFYIHVSHTRTHAGRTRLLVRVFAHIKHMQTNKQFHSELKCRWIEIELFHKPSLINQSHNKYFTHSIVHFLCFRSLSPRSFRQNILFPMNRFCVCACGVRAQCVCLWAIVSAWLWSPINNCEHSFSINCSFISVWFPNYTPQTYARVARLTCFELFARF